MKLIPEKRQLRAGKQFVLAALIAVVPGAVLAQNSGPTVGGGMARMQGGGGPGRGVMNMPQPLVTVPVSVLDSELKLSASQKQQIQTIEDHARKEFTAMMAQGGFGGGTPPGGKPGSPGGQPPQGAGRGGGGAMLAGMQGLSVKDSKAIAALLTPSQRAALPAMFAEISAMRGAGIPMGVLPELKLTADQKTRIAALVQKADQNTPFTGDWAAMRAAREKTHTQVLTLLSNPQKDSLKNWEKAHPRPSFGGPGGPGGPPR